MELEIRATVGLGPKIRSRSVASRAPLWLGCLVVSALLTASSALPQTLQAWKFPNGERTTLYPLDLTTGTCSQPSSASCTAYINPQDPYNETMPELEFQVSGYPSACAQIAWVVYADYLDPAGYEATAEDTDTTSPCSAAFMPAATSWTSPGGGTIVVDGYLETSCGTPVKNSSGDNLMVSMEFYIWGDNQSKAQTDAEENVLSPWPWFAGSIITYESCSSYSASDPTALADQFSPSSGFCNEAQNVANRPLWGGPLPDDGIGLMQPDRSVSGNTAYINSGTYFNYADNMQTAWDILWIEKATESYDNWVTEYVTDSDYHAVSGDKDYGTICSFSSDVEPLGDKSYADADWIQDYNTHSGGYYYLWWNATTKEWDFKYNYPSQPGYNYAEEVCEHAPY